MFFRSAKTAKLLMLRSDFRKKGVCSKSATKMLYWNKFLVSDAAFSNYLVIVRVAGHQRLVVRKRYR